MTPAEFRAWFANLPPNYQSAARAMYESARKTGTHSASSLLLIRSLIEDQINFDGDFTL
ncbi:MULTISPECIES: hypothetical protein [Enterobacteriaceae]|uniref:hypothetical protein n=1 Tax=Enterobacteriaceae TaxID=543 RepID=UPI00078B34AA|nr:MULTISPECIES: hypothetical protein [Enterobacteriaceae]AMO50793.1 Hypothetical protein AKI40_4418 [Enterobacter sp. FY-07]EKK3984580.1 hypothetical protein [Cronobacter sakazakii]ELY2551294.1 hypothetical protein [Cronobacter sakazakii]ELY6002791.1 hypothetical protein [Cronobacter sakazakii]ELY6402379.1 hypothetical protein [Cronobacter sakazakii]